MAMPWTLAKAKAAAIRADKTGAKLEQLNRLFNSTFRIQREACEAAGRHIPLLVENVRGAQPWVGRSRWAYGSFHLWGDTPALMPHSEGGRKQGGGLGRVPGDWFSDPTSHSRMYASKSPERKMASSMIAKIPLPLSRHIAATFRG